jgi:prevent-host-death family protein
MTKRYSVAEAKQNLPSLLRRVERAGPVEITRRGEVVAILVAAKDRDDVMPHRSLWDVIQAFRSRPDFAAIAFTDEEMAAMGALRDRSPGRGFSW